MARIDLDAERQQRKAPVKHTIVLGGEEFTFPDVGGFPLEAMDLISQGAFGEAFKLILGEEAYGRFSRYTPDVADANTLMRKLTAVAGVGNLGNLPGSPAPRASGGTRSKRTSGGTTVSTPVAS